MSERDSQILERNSRILEKEIESACRGARNLSIEDQSRLAQLITIWISGYLEVTCRNVLLSYAKRRSDASVARFVSQRLRRTRSPKTEEILRLVGSFDTNRAGKLKTFIQGRIGESVDGVVALRHGIAHGQPESVTIARVEEQFEDSRKLAAKMKELFDDES